MFLIIPLRPLHHTSLSLRAHTAVDYILFATKDVSLDPNPNEVSDARYVTEKELRQMFEDKGAYSLSISALVCNIRRLMDFSLTPPRLTFLSFTYLPLNHFYLVSAQYIINHTFSTLDPAANLFTPWFKLICNHLLFPWWKLMLDRSAEQGLGRVDAKVLEDQREEGIRKLT